jgi:Tol biopolymer transport system component
LDADPTFSPVAVAADGQRAYVALASLGTPSPEVRKEPVADRDLDIYEIDLTSGERHVVVDTPAEDFAPQVSAGHLHWTTASLDASVVVIPAAGGEARVVVPGGQVPTWRPDGRQMGYFFGQWRLADGVVNSDGGIVEVDSAGAPVGRPQAFITWYGEDFPPVWSPDGRWIAYHSHRSPTQAIPHQGSSDDIWLRRLGAPAAEDIRLTDFGVEAGSPDWSPDGTRLIFTSWEQDGEPAGSFPWMVTIEPSTGRPLRHGRLPLHAGIRGAEQAAWSPNGEEIAIEEKVGGDRQRLWVISTDGRSARKVVDYRMTTYGGVDWTPDGETLVYSAVDGKRMQLYSVPAKGGAPRKLTTDEENLLHPQVSPEGKLIAATRLLQRKELWRARLPER